MFMWPRSASFKKERGGLSPPSSFLDAKRAHPNFDDVRPQTGRRSQTARTLARARLAYLHGRCKPVHLLQNHVERVPFNLRGQAACGSHLCIHSNEAKRMPRDGGASMVPRGKRRLLKRLSAKRLRLNAGYLKESGFAACGSLFRAFRALARNHPGTDRNQPGTSPAPPGWSRVGSGLIPVASEMVLG